MENPKKKIVFVDPPMTAEKQAGSLKDVANIIPSLGIGYVAAVLEKHGYEPKIIDNRIQYTEYEQLSQKLRELNPDVIAFTSTILAIDACTALAKKLKNDFPDKLFVLGGPHITSLPKQTMENKVFDLGVLGEGEYTFLDLMRELEKPKPDLGKVKGLVFRKARKLVFTEPRPFVENLDELPFPALHLYPPLNKYHPVPASYKKLPFVHIMSSRGCPYQCIFCDRTVFGNRFRARSAKNVADEIEHLIKDFGIKEFKFFDDMFSLDQQRVMDICNELERRKIHLPWSCTTRVDRVSEELIKRMAEAGCWQIAFGLESGSQKILDKMKKGIKLEQSRKAVKWCQKYGIDVRAFFVLGMPGETKETIRETVQFAKDLGLDMPTFYTLMIYPGNELFHIVHKEGKLLHSDFSQYSSLINVNETKLHYVPEGMTEDELKHAISWAYKSFFLDPRYILRQFLKIRSLEDIKRYWAGFKTIVRM